MDFGNQLSQGGAVPVIGLGIIFAVLIVFLMIFIVRKWGFEQISVGNKTNQFSKIQNDITIEDNEELIAVITAAIAATLGTSTKKLRIKSLIRVHNWNNIARQERIF